jgi:hypothetical protein
MSGWCDGVLGRMRGVGNLVLPAATSTGIVLRVHWLLVLILACWG